MIYFPSKLGLKARSCVASEAAIILEMPGRSPALNPPFAESLVAGDKRVNFPKQSPLSLTGLWQEQCAKKEYMFSQLER